nr:uncharacterized protein LOC109415909 [Aedes albopictus]
MISNKHFRVMGIIYTGLIMTGSFLLAINSSITLKSTNGIEGETISGLSITMLIVSLVLLIFHALLMFAILKHRVEFIKFYLHLILIGYVLQIVNLLFGCIGAGIDIRNSGKTAYDISTAAMVMTMSYFSYISIATIQYTLIVWILKGVISTSSNNSMRLVSSGDAA